MGEKKICDKIDQMYKDKGKKKIVSFASKAFLKHSYITW